MKSESKWLIETNENWHKLLRLLILRNHIDDDKRWNCDIAYRKLIFWCLLDVCSWAVDPSSPLQRKLSKYHSELIKNLIRSSSLKRLNCLANTKLSSSTFCCLKTVLSLSVSALIGNHEWNIFARRSPIVSLSCTIDWAAQVSCQRHSLVNCMDKEFTSCACCWHSWTLVFT